MKINQHQQGSTLIMALVFLAMTATISTSLLNTGILEMKMVSNAQFQEEAFQITEGILDEIVTGYRTNLPIVGDVGYTVCGDISSVPGCNSASITNIATTAHVSSAVDLVYSAERLGPLEAPFPMRLDEGAVSSADKYSAAIYEINANYDGRSAKLGYQDVYEGVAILIAKASQ